MDGNQESSLNSGFYLKLISLYVIRGFQVLSLCFSLSIKENLMNYQEFLNYMEEHFSNYLLQFESVKQKQENVVDCENITLEDTNEYTVGLHQVFKNNGIKLDGLVIRKNNETVSPNIYLNSYFDSYQLGEPLHCIMEQIAKQYFDIRQEQQFEVDNLLDFQAVKDQIIIRLVNYEKNREVLKNCPHKRFLDLAVTYRYMVKQDAYGLASSLIRYDEFLYWEMDEDELYRIALFNTMREFPWHVESLTSVVFNCIKKTLSEEEQEALEMDFQKLEDEKDSVPMYVLSNDSGLNGASCMLYDSVIRNFAKVQGSNVVILPSSIHEIILVPEHEDTDMDLLQKLVLDANESAVGLIDLLSDSVYYYQLDKDAITIYSETIFDKA